MTLDRTMKNGAEAVKPRRVELDIGGFWVIKRTGAIERMRVCTE